MGGAVVEEAEQEGVDCLRQTAAVTNLIADSMHENAFEYTHESDARAPPALNIIVIEIYVLYICDT